MTVTSAPDASQELDGASLIDLVPELADGLSSREQGGVRAGARVRTITVPRGPWEPEALVGPGGVGFLLAEGAIIRDVLMAGSVASDLLGPGDVAALSGDDAALVPAAVRWSVSATARVALLDAELLAAIGAWPEVTARLLARATRQTSTLAVHRAISQLPRVDQRILALMWHLAERWGRVGRDGIVVRLALTHEALGRMVGARRPTVSLALKELASDGCLVRRPDGAWVLDRDGLQRLAPRGDGASWVPPDATILPDLGAPPPQHEKVAPTPPRTDLPARFVTLRGSYVEHQQRVDAVLERCAQTGETLKESRRRREEWRSSR